MKKQALFLTFGLITLLFAYPAQGADTGTTIRLIDREYYEQECRVFCADCTNDTHPPLCSYIDVVPKGYQNQFSVEVNVFDSGYLAVYIDDRAPVSGDYNGGIDYDQLAFFYPQSGADPAAIGDGLQVFTTGKVRLSWFQPYDSVFRKEMNYRVLVYFRPHTDHEKSHLNYLSLREPREYDEYRIDNAGNIDPLCEDLENSSLAPVECASTSVRRARVVEKEDLIQETSDSDFQPPEIEMERENIYAFTGQRVDIKINYVNDPDGLCDEFNYQWFQSDGPGNYTLSPDEYGNTYFYPQESGEYYLRLYVTENCAGHDLKSSQTVKVRITDKTTTFSDLHGSNPYWDHIMELYTRGVIQGYSDGTVKPYNYVSRAEFLKMLFETAEVAVPDSFSYLFPDVPTGEWYTKYVYFAADKGVVVGYPDNYFRPTHPVNRAEALKMALHITDIPTKETLEVQFGDFGPDDWFSRYIQTAYREGIIDIAPESNVYPGDYITRGEAAKILVRTFLHPVNRLNIVNLKQFTD